MKKLLTLTTALFTMVLVGCSPAVLEPKDFIFAEKYCKAKNSTVDYIVPSDNANAGEGNYRANHFYIKCVSDQRRSTNKFAKKYLEKIKKDVDTEK